MTWNDIFRSGWYGYMMDSDLFYTVEVYAGIHYTCRTLQDLALNFTLPVWGFRTKINLWFKGGGSNLSWIYADCM